MLEKFHDEKRHLPGAGASQAGRPDSSSFFGRLDQWAVQPPRLLKLAGVVDGIENVMRRAPDAALNRDSCRCQHLIQHPSPVPGFYRVEDEFSAVLAANDSGHALTLCQCVVAGLLVSVWKKICL